MQADIASNNNWSISISTNDFAKCYLLFHGSNFVSKSEDAFMLLSKCPLPIAQSLRSQLVTHTIQENGGTLAYQTIATDNRIKYGSDFYDYLDELTLREFANQGINLSYHT